MAYLVGVTSVIPEGCVTANNIAILLGHAVTRPHFRRRLFMN